MFTGIITHIAKVSEVITSESRDALLKILVSASQISRKLEIGCSIALNGICLTLIEKVEHGEDFILSFQASEETCQKTNLQNWQKGDLLNCEFALRVGDELGGHMVLGHVDDCAEIIAITEEKESHIFTFAVDMKWRKFVMEKGSIVIDGVSLTVNEIADAIDKFQFQINVIPHTFSNTIFQNYQVGDLVNLEIDTIARYAVNALGETNFLRR